MSADEKGKALERAVHAIEETILKSFPGYNAAAFQILRRKIIVVEGVRHEYDVWVEIDLAKGYRPIFVFECKNWEEKVGKNEVIVFSEKIAAAQAQNGYLVARAYTADAIAQAAKDPRLSLLTVQELPADSAAFLSNFHVIGIDQQHRTMSVLVATEQQDALARCSFSSAKAYLMGSPVDLEAYSISWGDSLRENHNRRFPSSRLPDGVYPVEIQDTRTFATGEFTVDDLDVLKVEFKLTFEVHVVWPRIGSAFQIATRGRVAFCEPVEVPGARLEITATGVDDDSGSAA